MAALDIPLLLVVGGYLGAISHTLTALDVLAQRKLKIATIVVTESERGTVELDDTVASIARFSERSKSSACRDCRAGSPASGLRADRRVALSRLVSLELTTVSIIPSKLTTPCSSMVSKI